MLATWLGHLCISVTSGGFVTVPVAECFWLEGGEVTGIVLPGPCRTAARRGYPPPGRSNPLRTIYAPTAPGCGKRGQLVNITGVFAHHMISSDDRSTIFPQPAS